MTRLLLPEGGVLDIPADLDDHDVIVDDLRDSGAVVVPEGAAVVGKDTPTALIAALIDALAEVTEVPKSRTAKIEKRSGGTFEYDYADIADVVNVTRPALAAHGLLALTPVHTVGENRLACTVRLLHRSGQTLEFEPIVFPAGGTAQDVGGQITYYRRYALVAALGIAAGDDSDAQTQDHQDRPQSNDRGDRGRPAKRTSKKAAARKKAAAPREEAKPKDPNEIVRGLIDKHGPEHAARVAVLIGRMNDVESEQDRKAIKTRFVEAHGSIADLPPEAYDAAKVWLDDVLAPADEAPRSTPQTEQSDGDDGGPHDDDCPECGGEGENHADGCSLAPF